MNKKLTLAVTFIMPLTIVAALPFGLNLKQGILLAVVILAASWWAVGVVNKNVTSILLIGTFLLFSGAPLKVVLRFPASSNFFLIIFAFLISEGITRSNLADRISSKLMLSFGYTPRRLVLLSFFLGIILIFLVPQPFPRVILVSAIYMQFLNGKNIGEDARVVILFSIYAASTCTSMIFLNGDILLNYTALEVSGISLNWIEWAVYMALPSIIICGLMYVLYIMIFEKYIPDCTFVLEKSNGNIAPLSREEKRAFIILSAVLVLWMTESLHGINPAWVSFFGALALYFSGLVVAKDFKKININLLLFLTSAYSIGGVLNYSGVAKSIYSELVKYLPGGDSILFYLFVIAVIMILHMFLGSSVTTISVGLPGLLSINGGQANPVVITLITYTVVSIHYLLPFHHATVMIGSGKNYYPNSYVIKYGIGLTILAFISVLLIEIPWWRVIGLI